MSAFRSVLSSLPWLRGLVFLPTSARVAAPDLADLAARVARLKEDVARLRKAVADRYGVIT